MRGQATDVLQNPLELFDRRTYLGVEKGLGGLLRRVLLELGRVLLLLHLRLHAGPDLLLNLLLLLLLLLEALLLQLLLGMLDLLGEDGRIRCLTPSVCHARTDCLHTKLKWSVCAFPIPVVRVTHKVKLRRRRAHDVGRLARVLLLLLLLSHRLLLPRPLVELLAGVRLERVERIQPVGG